MSDWLLGCARRDWLAGISVLSMTRTNPLKARKSIYQPMLCTSRPCGAPLRPSLPHQLIPLRSKSSPLAYSRPFSATKSMASAFSTHADVVALAATSLVRITPAVAMAAAGGGGERNRVDGIVPSSNHGTRAASASPSSERSRESRRIAFRKCPPSLCRRRSSLKTQNTPEADNHIPGRLRARSFGAPVPVLR